MYKRKIYKKLLDWKNNSKGKYAILIEGPRRVGKTTIVKEFAKNEYASYIYIDFNNASKNVLDIFENISNLDNFFLYLQTEFQTNLIKRKSAIIFDEVQYFPKARSAIKYLVEDGRYDYIETGSLISIHKNVKDILIPSEEHSIKMNPFDYEEFLWAIGDDTTNSTIQELIKNPKILPQVHRTLMQRFRLYMLVGGMPDPIKTYKESNNFQNVDFAKREILNLYENDFRKFDNSGALSKVFNAIPGQLYKNATTFQQYEVLGNKNSNRLMNIISEIIDSQTVLASYHVNDPNVGMSFSQDLSKFKLYLADTGLFITQMFKDKDVTENTIYKKLLYDKLPANLGFLYENIVAQMLNAKGDSLFFHAIYNKSTHKNYEIDFIISRKNKICPIEVKSSNYKTHKSLDVFADKYSGRILQKYLVYNKQYSKDKDIICIPPYLVPYI